MIDPAYRTRPRADEDGEDEEAVKPSGKMDDFVARELLKQRVIMVSRPVDSDLMSSVVGQLLVLDRQDSKAPITMYINCPGGDADSGFAIFDAMLYVRAPVTTVCVGLAASAAIIIFLGGRKGRRFSLPHSRFLIHQPSTYSQGSASDLEITAREIVKLRECYNAVIAKETGKTPKQVLKDVNRDFWLDAKEAVEYGLVSGVVGSLKDLNGS